MKVSVKAFLQNSDGRYLALRRSATDPNRPLTWDVPGGQLEEGEDHVEGIKRETMEEVGIEIGDVKVFDAQSGKNKKGVYSIMILLRGQVENLEIKLSYEHDQYEWVTKEEFLKLESSDKLRKAAIKL